MHWSIYHALSKVDDFERERPANEMVYFYLVKPSRCLFFKFCFCLRASTLIFFAVVLLVCGVLSLPLLWLSPTSLECRTFIQVPIPKLCTHNPTPSFLLLFATTRGSLVFFSSLFFVSLFLADLSKILSCVDYWSLCNHWVVQSRIVLWLLIVSTACSCSSELNWPALSRPVLSFSTFIWSFRPPDSLLIASPIHVDWQHT